MKQSEFKAKNIVITGGTSGLGRALVAQFLEHGARVAAVARKKAGLDRLQRDFPAVIAVQGDLSRAESIYPITGEISNRLGQVDILINCASYLGQTPLRLMLDTECEDFAEVLETNLLAPFRLTKAMIPSMVLRKSGMVVNISSDAAVNAYPTWGAYSVSKAALDHMTRIFRAELKEKNIGFLAVDPGDMNTPMHFSAIPDADPKELRDPADSAAEIIELIHTDRGGEVRRAI